MDQKRKASHSLEKKEGENPFSHQLFLANIEPHMDENAIYKLVKKALKSEDTGLVSINKPRGQGHAILTFHSTEQCVHFETMVLSEKTKCKNRRIKLKPVTKQSDHRNEMTIEQINLKQNELLQSRQKEPEAEDIAQLGAQPIIDRICPLHHLPYEEQLSFKKDHLTKIITNLNNKLQENVFQEKLELSDFIPADQLTLYRNKEEFTFGFDHLKALNVGFTKSDFSKGVVLVDEPKDCLIASEISIEVAKLVQDYARSLLPEVQPYNKIKHEGFWRNMVVRDSQKTKQLIVNLVVADQQMEHSKMAQIKKELADIFKEKFKNHAFELKALVLTVWNDPSDCVPTHIVPEFLIGSQNQYEEIILDKHFLVSSSAFLQIHIPQCEKLYASIEQELEIDQDTTFLDICSGIGTIGLCVGNKAKKIIQVEMIESACEDAKVNAELNGQENVEIHAKKIEDVAKDIFKNLEGTRLVGVVDPPRNGLHPSVCQVLRTLKGLNKVVYVACNASAVVDNLLNLCLNENKNKRKGPPFFIKKVYGADLFPQTSHYETVFVLER